MLVSFITDLVLNNRKLFANLINNSEYYYVKNKFVLIDFYPVTPQILNYILIKLNRI